MPALLPTRSLSDASVLARVPGRRNHAGLERVDNLNPSVPMSVKVLVGEDYFLPAWYDDVTYINQVPDELPVLVRLCG